MPLQGIEGRVLNGGLIRGLPAYMVGTSESPDCDNTDPADMQGATTRPGSAIYGVAGASAGSGAGGGGIFPWVRDAGTTYIFAAFATSIYSVDSGSWFAVKTGVATDSIMQGVSMNNTAILVASGIAPQVSTAGSTLVNLSASAPSLSKYITEYVQKVFMAGNPGDVYNLDWSKTNDPTVWQTASGGGSSKIGNGDGDLVRGIQGTKRALYIFKRGNLYILVGDSTENFESHRIAKIGLVSERGVASDGQGCFFASDDGIYYVSGLDMVRISDPIRDEYKDIADKSTIAMEVKTDRLFCFYNSASSGTVNDKCLVAAYKRMMPDGSIKVIWGRYTLQPFNNAKAARDTELYGLTNASTVSIYKLDTGSAGGITTEWNTPDMDFGENYAKKTLSRFFIHGKSPDATTTLTLQWFADGASVGSQYSVTVGTTGSLFIVQKSARSVATVVGNYLRLEMKWNKPMTVYGFRVYADIHVESDMPRR